MENLEDRNLLSVMADVPVAAQHTLSSGPITIDPIVQGAKLNNSAGPKYDTQTTVVSVSPTGPVFGELMKFEAKINCSGSSSALSGNITFKDTVNGEITSTITTAVNGPPGVIVFVYDRWLPAGSNSITAQYNGDATHNPSPPSSAYPVTVKQASTTTVIASQNLSSGQPIILTATVSPVAPGAGRPRAP